MKKEHNTYTKDGYGKDIILGAVSEKDQIMMEWEQEYMQKCVRKLNPFGDVLEVGFGLAYSASEIQKHNINSHTIIECDPEGYRKALEWAKKQKHKTEIVFGEWQSVYKTLGNFDCFFFDPHPIFYVKEYDLDLHNVQDKIDILSVSQAYNYPQLYYMYDMFSANLSFISEMLKYNSNDFAKFSFYCVEHFGLNCDEYYRGNLFHQNPNFSTKFEINVFDRKKVADNCNYVDNLSEVMIPLLEVEKLDRIYYPSSY